MKRWKSVLALALCMLLLPTVALADVIWEPDDPFYESHADACEYLPREYTVNGKDGYAAVWKSPEGAKAENIANGEVLSAAWIYTAGDGAQWCGVQRGENWGWIKLSDCAVVPDYLTFEQQHGSEFVGWDNAYDHALEELDTVVLWKYPGSGQVVFQADAKWFRENAAPGESITTCYQDGEGRFWGFVPYCYGVRNTWVCLSDPTNQKLAADADILPQTGLIPPADHIPEPGLGVEWIVVFMVAAVCGVTAVLIPLLYRRKQK